MSRTAEGLLLVALVLLCSAPLGAAPIHIDVTGPQSGTCIVAGDYQWTTAVSANHGGGHFRFAGYHSHQAGCEPTGENGASSYFVHDGPLQFADGLSGVTTWLSQQPGRKCGRVQYDIDWMHDDTGWIFGVMGIVMDYGVDCDGYVPPGAPPESVPEPALLALLGVGLWATRRRMR